MGHSTRREFPKHVIGLMTRSRAAAMVLFGAFLAKLSSRFNIFVAPWRVYELVMSQTGVWLRQISVRQLLSGPRPVIMPQ
jgi:hypothetical protein